MFTLKSEDISEEGLTLNWDEQQDSLQGYLSHLSSIDFRFESPLHGEATIKRIGASYLLHGTVQTLLRVKCVRCLKEFLYPLSSAYDLTLHPSREEAFGKTGEEETEVVGEDMEASFFEKGEIHLSEIACEQIFLEVPYQPLCRENCKGLCPQCGQDRNVAPCHCSSDEQGSGFSVLRKLKLGLPEKGR